MPYIWQILYSSSEALYRHRGAHLRWKCVCYSAKCTMSTLGCPASSCTSIYRSIALPRHHLSRRCEPLPCAWWEGCTLVLHNINRAALGPLRLRSDHWGYAIINICNNFWCTPRILRISWIHVEATCRPPQPPAICSVASAMTQKVLDEMFWNLIHTLIALVPRVDKLF